MGAQCPPVVVLEERGRCFLAAGDPGALAAGDGGGDAEGSGEVSAVVVQIGTTAEAGRRVPSWRATAAADKREEEEGTTTALNKEPGLPLPPFPSQEAGEMSNSATPGCMGSSLCVC